MSSSFYNINTYPCHGQHNKLQLGSFDNVSVLQRPPPFIGPVNWASALGHLATDSPLAMQTQQPVYSLECIATTYPSSTTVPPHWTGRQGLRSWILSATDRPFTKQTQQLGLLQRRIRPRRPTPRSRMTSHGQLNPCTITTNIPPSSSTRDRY